MKCLKFLRLGFPQVRSSVYLGVSKPPITICIHVLLHTCMPPEIIIIRSWASPFISSAFALLEIPERQKKKESEFLYSKVTLIFAEFGGVRLGKKELRSG